jgi:hypothetical protein
MFSIPLNPSAWSRLLLVTGLLTLPLGAALAAWQDQWPKTEFDKAVVPLEEITSGGPPRDGIPSIDQPKFVDRHKAEKWLDRDEPVIVLTLGGDARAYPLQILIWHEIVNDRVGGRPVSITFCPLCNASIVFDRQFDGQVLDFGTTGRLRRSDMVMYDRQTETWWQQFSGQGLIGLYAGETLTQLPTRIVSFADFIDAHPDGKILSRDTGYRRSYGRNPYRGYDRIGNIPFLLNKPADPRLPAMERVLAVTSEKNSRLYPYQVLRKQPVINDKFGEHAVVVLSRSGTLSVLDAGQIAESRRIPSANAFDRRVNRQLLEFEQRGTSIVDRQTGSEWNILGEAVAGPLAGTRLTPLPGGVHFAFAWLVFNPDSEIYRP